MVVESGVWIDYFNGVRSEATNRLDATLGVDEVATGDLILVEVLQGFRDDRHFRAARKVMTGLPVIPMLGVEAALRSAQAYRTLRRRGITVRKTIDVIIACACIEARLSLLFSDRDFQPFVDHLGLEAVINGR